MNDFVISWLMVSIVLVQSIVGYQFRFEVPDNDQECFGQELDIDTQVTIEYRVKFDDSFVFSVTIFLQNILHSVLCNTGSKCVNNFGFLKFIYSFRF